MPRAIVTAASQPHEMIVLEDDSRRCGVFWLVAGPAVLAGDILDGDIASQGRCRFVHAKGHCWARGWGTVMTRTDALLILEFAITYDAGFDTGQLSLYP